MKSEPATIDRVQAFVEEALRWLPNEAEGDVDTMPSAGSSPTGPPRPSVLLAEDNADMRDYVHGLLDGSFEVSSVANGQEALDAIRKKLPDLVLSDVMMPLLDGFELLTAIRREPASRNIPVILLSARAREEDRIEGLDKGADDYVTKPFSAPELQARIRASLSLAGMRREAVEELVESDKRLLQLNADLEARINVEIQTREAVLTRLAQAEKTAALGQLAGGMAHDFNNILQIVLGYASIIQLKSNDVPAVERMARVIEDAARRGHAVTQRLLVFTRQDGSRPEAVDLAEMLEGLRDVMALTIGPRMTLVVELPPSLPLALVDRSQLETVLINLATNAADAMPNGGTLTVSAEAQVMTDMDTRDGLRAGSYISISVRDTGTGMDEPTLARVTEPFFTTKRVGKGTGLGLALADGFAEQSGGAMTIASAPGLGTTVTLLLPSTESWEEVNQTDKDRDHARSTVGEKQFRILLADDDMRVRDAIGELIDGAGYNVILVADAAAALAVLGAGEKVDLLVSDLSMPGIDGVSLIRAAQLQRPSLPAILLTGYASDGILSDLGGSFSLLRKPVNGPQLANELKSLLENV